MSDPENPRRALKVEGMWRNAKVGRSQPTGLPTEYGELADDWLYSIRPNVLDSRQVGFCAFICEPVAGTPDPSDDLSGRGCYFLPLNFATPEEARAAAFGYFWAVKHTPGYPDPHAVYTYQVQYYKPRQSK